MSVTTVVDMSHAASATAADAAAEASAADDTDIAAHRGRFRCDSCRCGGACGCW